MNRVIKIILLLVALAFFSSVEAKAFTPLDEILEYYITVEPTEEGNLNMKYHLKWKVLDDDKEGPLEWIKIGVPNKYVSNIQIYSPIIENAQYYSDGGAYIRLDLTRKVYKDEIINLDFSFTQTHIYNLEGDYVEYSFMPGWFSEIRINKMRINWHNKNVYYCDTNSYNGNYYIWEANNLDYGRTIKANVKYHKDAFINLNEANQFTNKYMTKEDYIVIFVILTVISGIVISIIVSSYLSTDGYESYRGFAGVRTHRRWWWFYHRRGVNSKGEEIKPVIVRGSSGHSGSSGSSCACACACACAGGGRAGCSRKDFYNPTIEVDEVIKQLEE